MSSSKGESEELRTDESKDENASGTLTRTKSEEQLTDGTATSVKHSRSRSDLEAVLPVVDEEYDEVPPPPVHPSDLPAPPSQNAASPPSIVTTHPEGEPARKLPMSRWTQAMVNEFLVQHNLADLVSLFESQKITGISLKTLTDAELATVGVVALGDRKTLLAAVEEQKAKEARHRSKHSTGSSHSAKKSSGSRIGGAPRSKHSSGRDKLEPTSPSAKRASADLDHKPAAPAEAKPEEESVRAALQALITEKNLPEAVLALPLAAQKTLLQQHGMLTEGVGAGTKKVKKSAEEEAKSPEVAKTELKKSRSHKEDKKAAALEKATIKAEAKKKKSSEKEAQKAAREKERAKKKQKFTPVFGHNLADVLASQIEIGGDPDVPLVFSSCLKYINREAVLKLEGIFRVSGRQEAIQEMKTAFNHNELPDFSGIQDPHTITGLMKLWLRELPQPLYPFSVYQEIVQAGKTTGPQLIESARGINSKLPKQNLVVLTLLVELLHSTLKYKDTTKMSETNLAIVISPNIIRPEVETMQTAMGDSPLVCDFFAFVIAHFPEIFKDAPATARISGLSAAVGEGVESVQVTDQLMDPAKKEPNCPAQASDKLAGFLKVRPTKELLGKSGILLTE